MESAVFPAEDMELMLCYSWPGNIRQLGNFVERSFSLNAGGRERCGLCSEHKKLLREACARHAISAEPASLGKNAQPHPGQEPRRVQPFFTHWLELAEHLENKGWSLREASTARGWARNRIARSKLYQSFRGCASEKILSRDFSPRKSELMGAYRAQRGDYGLAQIDPARRSSLSFSQVERLKAEKREDSERYFEGLAAWFRLAHKLDECGWSLDRMQLETEKSEQELRSYLKNLGFSSFSKLKGAYRYATGQLPTIPQDEDDG